MIARKFIELIMSTLTIFFFVLPSQAELTSYGIVFGQPVETRETPDAPEAAAATCNIEVNVNSSLNVRRSVWGEICDNVRSGHNFEVIGRSDDWLQVRACGGLAFVNQVGFANSDWQSITQLPCGRDNTAIEPVEVTDETAPEEAPQGAAIGWNGDARLQRIAMAEVIEHNLADLNPSDIGSYCPRYSSFNEQQRNQYWSTFMYAMSIPESGTRDNVRYTESFRASCRLSSGENYSGRVISTGLLQVSACSCIGYGERIQNLQSLHDSTTNLSCGARVLSRQIGRHGVIRGRTGSNWRGASSYWAVVRNQTKNREIQQTIRRTMPSCHN